MSDPTLSNQLRDQAAAATGAQRGPGRKGTALQQLIAPMGMFGPALGVNLSLKVLTAILGTLKSVIQRIAPPVAGAFNPLVVPAVAKAPLRNLRPGGLA